MLISFSIVLSLSWILVLQTFQSQPLFKRPAARGDGIALFQSADPSSPSNFEQSRLPWWNFPGRLQSLELQFQSLEVQFQSLKDGQKLFYAKEDALAMEERNVVRMEELEERGVKRMKEMEEKLDRKMAEMVRLMVIMFAISSAIAAASGYFGRTIP